MAKALRCTLLGWLLVVVGASGMAQAQGAESTSTPAKRYSIVPGAEGVPLNVVDQGAAGQPVIVMVHGFGQSHASFEAQFAAPELNSHFRLVSYDLRGHGMSGKPWAREAYTTSALWAEDLARVIEVTGARKVVLVGWSYGTLVIGDYLRKYGSERLAGVILTGAYGGFTDPPNGRTPPPATVIAEMNRMRDEQMSGDPQLRAAAVRRGVLRLTGKAMPEAWIAQATTMGMLTATEARRFMFDRPIDNKDVLPKLNVPLLVVIGGKDGSTPEQQGRDLAARVRGATATFYPESGHSPFAEEPERFNRELGSFARTASASP
ncbi:MAG: alpha/beta hydrolase [Sinobacteraceae bacterium]|nr:alpha/beta hydrolase [Nevskiaceae bacterium]